MYLIISANSKFYLCSPADDKMCVENVIVGSHIKKRLYPPQILANINIDNNLIKECLPGAILNPSTDDDLILVQYVFFIISKIVDSSAHKRIIFENITFLRFIDTLKRPSAKINDYIHILSQLLINMGIMYTPSTQDETLKLLQNIVPNNILSIVTRNMR